MGNRDLQVKLFEYNFSETQNLVEKRKVAKSDTEGRVLCITSKKIELLLG